MEGEGESMGVAASGKASKESKEDGSEGLQDWVNLGGLV